MHPSPSAHAGHRQTLLGLFRAALEAADPARLVPPALPAPPPGRTLVLGAGKASAAMARAVEESWPAPLGGLVLTRYGHGVACRQIEIVEAGHPVPDAAGEAAARRSLAMAAELGADDLLLALVSGGGSALLAAPAAGISLAGKRAVTRALLAAGARIGEINTVRKHLSASKGGRLAALAFPARVVALAVSDVPGDDPATIASGPTVADPTTLAAARQVLARYRIEPPAAIAAHLAAAPNETPKPGDRRLARARFHTLASAGDCLAAAAAAAAAEGGGRVRVLGPAIEGPAVEVAGRMAALARRALRRPGRQVLLSGGECTVEVRGRGRGGPNAEFVLAFALAMGGARGVSVLAADTDGIDGVGGHAGAVALPDTLDRARAAGLDPAAALADNDAAGFFAALGDLVVTGPTRTNVSDFRAIIVEPN